ncbi:MAG: discoidin domain-containing protein [Prevotella sp.]|jgi:hypothetical protein|nr:discoidin domain-containing protein [Prevotella sp.]
MKKILLLMLVSIVFFSCKDDDILTPTSLAFEEENPILEAGETSKNVPFKTTSPTISVALEDETVTWCTVTIEGENLVIKTETNESYAARETNVKVIASDRETSLTIKQNGRQSVKMTILSATASSFQEGEEIEKSFDGNVETYYHSNWSEKKDTYELIYKLQEDAPSLDLISYYPRTNAGNGTFGEIEIYASTKANSNFVKVAEYDCKMVGTPSHIALSTSVINPVAVKIVVKTGKGGFASCCEMEFYAKK